jgi:DNA-binding NarL/FixJ family response regulator
LNRHHVIGPMPIRVAIAEDNLMVREGLERIIAASPELELVAACRDLDELERAIVHGRPDVVLTDIRMPPTMTDEGIRLAVRLRAERSPVAVIALSQYADAGLALALLDRGSEGRGYLLKESVRDREQLWAAVAEVAAGGSVVDPKLVDGLVKVKQRDGDSPLAALTPREREVLAQIAQGRSNAAIAESLVLTKRAVEKYINSIFIKLDLADSEDVSKRVKAALVFLTEIELAAPR